MSTITRTWLAMAALGAGLTHIALGAGAPLPLALPLIAVAIAEMMWAGAAVMRDRLPLPTAALVGSLVPLLGWALLIAAASVAGAPELLAPLPFLPMAAATVMGLFIAAVLAVDYRRRKAGPTADQPTADQPGAERSTLARASVAQPSTGRYLLGVLVGGLLVSGLTTPALASTSAGLSAVPHGTHGTSTVVDEHSGH